MNLPRLTKLELQIIEALWNLGPTSIREIQEAFPVKKRPAYSTILTMVQRLEAKKAVRRVKKIATAFIFEAAIPRDAARRRLIDDFLAVFGGEAQPIMTHLIEAGKLSLEDVQDAERHCDGRHRRAEPRDHVGAEQFCEVAVAQQFRRVAELRPAHRVRPGYDVTHGPAVPGGYDVSRESARRTGYGAERVTSSTLRREALPELSAAPRCARSTPRRSDTPSGPCRRNWSSSES